MSFLERRFKTDTTEAQGLFQELQTTAEGIKSRFILRINPFKLDPVGRSLLDNMLVEELANPYDVDENPSLKERFDAIQKETAAKYGIHLDPYMQGKLDRVQEPLRAMAKSLISTYFDPELSTNDGLYHYEEAMTTCDQLAQTYKQEVIKEELFMLFNPNLRGNNNPVRTFAKKHPKVTRVLAAGAFVVGTLGANAASIYITKEQHELPKVPSGIPQIIDTPPLQQAAALPLYPPKPQKTPAPTHETYAIVHPNIVIQTSRKDSLTTKITVESLIYYLQEHAAKPLQKTLVVGTPLQPVILRAMPGKTISLFDFPDLAIGKLDTQITDEAEISNMPIQAYVVSLRQPQEPELWAKVAIRRPNGTYDTVWAFIQFGAREPLVSATDLNGKKLTLDNVMDKSFALQLLNHESASYND